MNPRNAAVALGAASALALGAYSIGSAAGDGSATTASENRRGPSNAMLEDKAETLGVTVEQLRTALEEIRSDRDPADRRVSRSPASGRGAAVAAPTRPSSPRSWA